MSLASGVSRLARSVALIAIAAALFVVSSGCSRRPPNATPEGAVRELIERLRRVQGDPSDAKDAYILLSKRAQANLAARAQRY
ncbi:MAG: hypothetical protein HUU21_30710, partial [Polyangiaceae bacterium]|nr:hypothetical protein [Polyangiaceae bacterium]